MGLSMQKVSELELAIEQGDAALPKVTALLNSGVSPNCQIRHRSAVYFAIEKDRSLIAEHLLAQGASVRVGYFTETPLHIAAARGNLHVTGKLLERGAHVNSRNHNGCTPLWLAASEGHDEVVDLLLRQPGVCKDCYCNDAFLLRSLARTSSLCQAVIKQHLNVCKVLLIHGASANLPDIKDCTPLHHACRLGNAAIASLLVQHGSSLNCIDRDGYTPLHTAVIHDRSHVVDVLIQAGCDINFACEHSDDFSPLHCAAKRGNPDLVAALCSATGIQIDSRDRYSMTPLIIACKNGNVTCLRELLDSGADVNSLDSFGLRPLSHAVCLEEDPRLQWRLQQWQLTMSEKQYGEKEQSVFCHTADVKDSFQPRQETDQTGPGNQNKECSLLESIIWSVAQSVGAEQHLPHLDVLHVLITGGADLHLKDGFQKTAVEYAMNLYGFRSVLMLLCHGATINEELLKSFLATNYLKPKCIMHGFIFPLVVALMWSSVQYHRLFHSYYLKFPFHHFYDLPLSIKLTLQQPLSLARHCRSVVRDALIRKSSCSIIPLVQQLPVPKAVKQFLLLSDVLRVLLVSPQDSPREL